MKETSHLMQRICFSKFTSTIIKCGVRRHISFNYQTLMLIKRCKTDDYRLAATDRIALAVDLTLDLMKAVFSKLYKNKVEPMEDQLPSTSAVKEDLPQTFNVRYLGFREAKGLWGIKHTRKPVDTMVASVKESKTDLHIVKLILTKDGCKLESIFKGKIETRYFPIETISYGVQDLVYTRVFAMIVVKDKSDFPHQSPFECHAFVCDSRQSARKLTYTLATAFQEYSRKLRSVPHMKPDPRKRFAIDLRTPEEMRTELRHQDSEA